MEQFGPVAEHRAADVVRWRALAEYVQRVDATLDRYAGTILVQAFPAEVPEGVGGVREGHRPTNLLDLFGRLP